MLSVIKTFGDRATERVANDERTRAFSADVEKAARRKLALLDTAVSLDDLRVPPGNRLEKLKGNRNGQHSIRINQQFRLCFRWSEGDAYDVEIVDYHD
jgi:toxin HigB-1